ncbi:uncharacterized protein LOC123695456 [Colias croceus]|uniref:uncharacterized protein LOC123695456 n=1 Tax=Colias crocea TaxID=72248 RepID=UPI001E27FDC9|nr:uncharacterized protein LOC123695456 [Colias croceus]
MSRQGAIKMFNSQNIPILIEEVKKRECIWNPECEDYNDRTIASIAWGQISDILNVPESKVRMKWKTIRDLFKREVRRAHIKHDIKEYKGKWKYFKALWFLQQSYYTSTEDYEVLVVEPDESPKRIKFEPCDETSYSEEYAIDPLPEDRSSQVKSEEDDYDLMYLKSLTPFLRELDPIRKLVVRNKIQDLILNEMAAQASSRKH